ncbi:hypothetical protein KYK29_04315 [Shinella daejeonensis]|uniref:hypothetical protein n=1 Tax=Shinella daejeonensis TaxID=659017 RepID=UPI0020C76037|nr:hypothetical protein [Shinella daejeonensis]MCP8894144.1 hypothetical protein [Shinella daejeonensis]
MIFPYGHYGVLAEMSDSLFIHVWQEDRPRSVKKEWYHGEYPQRVWPERRAEGLGA